MNKKIWMTGLSLQRKPTMLMINQSLQALIKDNPLLNNKRRVSWRLRSAKIFKSRQRRITVKKGLK